MRVFSSSAFWVMTLSVAALAPPPLQSADPIPENPSAMAARIDELLSERFLREDVQPAPRADDAAFHRRIHLDLGGVIPGVAQTRSFLEDQNPRKRDLLIERLTRSAGFASHMSVTWRNRLLPDNFDPAQLQNAVGLQNWLREQFVDNLRYDNLVAEFLVATGGGNRGPGIYYTAHEMKPEKLAASSARVFMGIQIQCAECHDHPFDRWTQTDFWGFAAFFARIRQPGDSAMNQIEDLPSGEVTLPDTEQTVAPKYPGSRLADPTERGTRRRQLAIWMASRDNPFLPRSAANWAWAHMFGRGIVHPVDDLSDNNPPSHPQLLDELSRYFVEQGFDLQILFQTLAMTEAYQRASEGGNEAADRPDLFARMAVKTLTPEQLYDSLATCLTSPDRVPQMPLQVRGGFFDPRRQEFLVRMQSQSRDRTEYDAGLPQALFLMNGPLVGEATDPDRSGLLTSLEAPFFTPADRLRILTLATLSRMPTGDEQSRFEKYLQGEQQLANPQRALGDVLWALLNSAEFTLNH